MEKWIFICLVTIGLASCGRKIASNNVPEPVKTSFNEQFPKSKNAEWKKHNNKYKVYFHNKYDQYMFARYKEDGSLRLGIRQCTATCLESN